MNNVAGFVAHPNLAALDVTVKPELVAAIKGANFVPLTPEALLEYCGMSLRNLDQQIQTLFAKQNGRNALSGALSTLNTRLSEHPETVLADEGKKEAIRTAFQEAINAAAATGDSKAKTELETQLANFNATTVEGKVGDASIDKEELKKLADAVASIQSDTNRAGELDMIQLQSMMSARQQAVSLTTNMLQTLNQGMNQIAQNMRG